MKVYLGMFNYWHRNPPPSFNDQYNPNASKAMSLAVKQLEAEGWYKNTSLEQRQNTTVLYDKYESILKELGNG